MFHRNNSYLSGSGPLQCVRGQHVPCIGEGLLQKLNDRQGLGQTLGLAGLRVSELQQRHLVQGILGTQLGVNQLRNVAFQLLKRRKQLENKIKPNEKCQITYRLQVYR